MWMKIISIKSHRLLLPLSFSLFSDVFLFSKLSGRGCGGGSYVRPELPYNIAQEQCRPGKMLKKDNRQISLALATFGPFLELLGNITCD